VKQAVANLKESNLNEEQENKEKLQVKDEVDQKVC
jgi:hypothetical protein